MAKTSTTQFYSFFGREALNGGLNVSDNPLIIGPAELTVAQNITIAQSLARKKRPGQTDYHLSSFASTASYPAIGASNPIRGIIQYWRYASATGVPVEDLFLHQNSKVWSIASQTSAAIDRTGALVINSTGRISYQVFEGILYFCSSNTTDGYNKWNGVATIPGPATAATPPTDGPGKYLGVYLGRMVMAGNNDFPFRLYISAPLDGDDWTSISGGTSLDIDYDGDPEGITAIFPQYQGRLFFATRRSIYELTGTTIEDLIVARISKGIGCVGHTTVVATPNDILFASDRGVHSLAKMITSDQSEFNFLSRPIQKLWTDLLTSNLLNQGQAIWEETQNLYIISVPSSGQVLNDTILCYNLTYGVWTSWTDINARSLSTLLLSNKPYVLCGREDGRISYLNTNLSTDFGEGFSGQFKTGKFFPGGDITGQKFFKSITLLCSTVQPSTITINWYIDGIDSTLSGGRSITLGNSAELLGSTFILGSSRLGQGRFLPIRLSIENVGYNFQLEVISGGDSDIEFYGYVLEVDNADPQYT